MEETKNMENETDVSGEENKNENDIILDPGQNEGKEKKHEPGINSPRWNEVYAKWKNAEKELQSFNDKFKQLETEKRKTSEDLLLLKSQYEKLFELTNKSETKEPKSNKTEQLNEIDDLLNRAMKEKKTALKEEDIAKALEIQDVIDDLRDKKRAAFNVPPRVNVNEEVSKALEKQESERAVNEFVSETPWINRSMPEFDSAMYGYAVVLEKELSPGWNGSLKSLYNEVRKRVEARFNYNDNNNNKTKSPISPEVERVGAESFSKNNDVKLTDEEKKTARLIFPNDPKAEYKYKESLKILRKGGSK